MEAPRNVWRRGRRNKRSLLLAVTYDELGGHERRIHVAFYGTSAQPTHLPRGHLSKTIDLTEGPFRTDNEHCSVERGRCGERPRLSPTSSSEGGERLHASLSAIYGNRYLDIFVPPVFMRAESPFRLQLSCSFERVRRLSGVNCVGQNMTAASSATHPW